MDKNYGENNQVSSSGTDTVVNLAMGIPGEFEVKIFMRKEGPTVPGQNPKLEAIQKAIELLQKQPN